MLQHLVPACSALHSKQFSPLKQFLQLCSTSLVHIIIEIVFPVLYHHTICMVKQASCDAGFKEGLVAQSKCFEMA